VRFLLEAFGVRKQFRYGVRAGSRWPFTMNDPIYNYAPFPFFIGYTAAYLKQNGYEVHVIDHVVSNKFSYDGFFHEVKREKADMVIVECSTPTIDIDLWVCKKISQHTRVALAGPHVAPNLEDLQNNHRYIDFFLTGEYILSALDVAKSLKPGVYRNQKIADLNQLPFPYRNYENADNYYDPSMPTAKPQLQLYGAKGCPFKCSFCMWPQTMYQGKVSLRKPELIAQEIKECIRLHGYKSIFFDDDTFNLGNERISELCDELKKIGLPWTMMGRLDCSPEWLLDKMVDSGCVGMRFGIETFNIAVLAKINKGLENKNFQEVLVNICKKYRHVMIHVTMMQDMPTQTDDIHHNDLKILKEMGFSNDNVFRTYQVAKCVPFPGTPLYNELVKIKGKKAVDDFSLYDGGQDTIMRDLDDK
jgi:radical SAM superfamily enzyme YgiQ (UPF0313 family)